MSSVYGNTNLNLAATAAPDGHMGLLFPRNPSPVKASYVKMPSRDNIDFILVNRGLWDQSVEDSPLARRAWVIQERFLAPRTLHFTSKQLFWECRQHTFCETFPDVRRQHSPIFYGSRLRESGGNWMLWRGALEHYCRALLTKEEDKLIAISGIAKFIHSLTGDKYIAGLWQNGIEHQLLWTAAGKEKSGVPFSYQLSNTRPSRYRAPSWSWASLDGPVETCHWLGKDFPKLPICVLSTDIRLLSENEKFGGVEFGSLEMECEQLKHTIIRNKKIWLHTEPEPTELICVIDIGYVEPSDEIFLLLVDDHYVYFDADHNESETLKGLLLQSTGRQGQYKRFGSFAMPCTGDKIIHSGLSLAGYLALPGVTSEQAYSKVCFGERGGENRYIIILI